ncbi:L-histidine N(alpha)-methyltransferase [Bradyrhizobium liaoningense]
MRSARDFCGRRFNFGTLETIHTESSRKCTAESFERLACSGGRKVAELWQDADGLFGLFGSSATERPMIRPTRSSETNVRVTM